MHPVARNALASVAQIVLSACAFFELYRFLMRHLTVEEIGVWSLVLAISFVGKITDFGLGGGVVRFVAYYFGRGATHIAAQTVGSAFVATALLVGMASCALYPLLVSLLPLVLDSPYYFEPAQELLPYALVTFWLASVSNVFLSALDGSQRIHFRAVLVTAATVVQLVAAYLIVPQSGLIGLGVISVIQSSFSLAMASVVVIAVFRQPGRTWVSWNRRRFRVLFRYGIGLQISVIGQLLFDPLIKVLLSKFGGLTMTGYYDMANRLVLQFRSIIIAAFQALVPYVAASRKTKSELSRTYQDAYRLLFYVAVPYFSLIAAGLPLLLTAWRGGFDEIFLAVAMLCVVSSTFNALTAPAYFVYVAVGQLRWTITSHVAIGLLTLVIGVLGGVVFGGFGVISAAALALIIGSFIVPFAFHREYAVPMPLLFPKESVPLALVCISGASALIWGGVTYQDDLMWFWNMVTALVLFLAGLVVCAWYHPGRTIIDRMIWQPNLRAK
jgi:O-antigen/teichoic acid export membrane protein